MIYLIIEDNGASYEDYRDWACFASTNKETAEAKLAQLKSVCPHHYRLQELLLNTLVDESGNPIPDPVRKGAQVDQEPSGPAYAVGGLDDMTLAVFRGVGV